MKRAIDLLTDVHFTRLDLAFDVFNNELGMKYRIYRQTSHSANIQQIRQYNKLVEQTKEKDAAPRRC